MWWPRPWSLCHWFPWESGTGTLHKRGARGLKQMLLVAKKKKDKWLRSWVNVLHYIHASRHPKLRLLLRKLTVYINYAEHNNFKSAENIFSFYFDNCCYGKTLKDQLFRGFKWEFCITHIFLCCRWCAETLHLSECWGSHLHRPPRLETEKERFRGGKTTQNTQACSCRTLLSHPRAAPCGPSTT